MRWKGNLIVMLCVLAASTFDAAHASNNAEVSAGIQLGFSAPGARSLALGGAFVGLADDATAAFTNPAGLTALTRPEVSMELRRTRFDSVFTDRGRASGTATGNGADTVNGLVLGSAESEVDNVSYLSFVYPRKRWAVALYRHELANYEATFRSNGAFFDATDLASQTPMQFRLFPIKAAIALKIENIGLSVAYRVGERLSLGVGLSRYHFTLGSLTERFDTNGFFEELDSSAPLINQQTLNGDDEDFGFNLGLLWSLGERWTLGTIYRQGPKFDLKSTNSGNPTTRPASFDPIKKAGIFSVPDVYGVGLAYRPNDRLTVTLDYHRVEYSSLTASVIDIFDDIPAPERQAAIDRLVTEDGDEIRLGIEYIVLGTRLPLALRCGAWHDPDHRIRFDGAPDASLEEQTWSTLFQPGDDEMHYSVGFGLVVSERFQIDVAADFSDLVDTLSVSGVLRF